MARSTSHYGKRAAVVVPKPPEAPRHIDGADVQARAEARAITRIGMLAPRRQDARITSSVAWSPKNGPICSAHVRRYASNRATTFVPGRDTLRGPLVRGHSNRTPKLTASYVRVWGEINPQLEQGVYVVG
jgi:hypothetical protein